jgi:uncharacterized protein YcbX
VFTVSRLDVAPVKGLALNHPDSVELTPTGVPENRRFYLVEENWKLVNGTKDGPLFLVRAETDPEGTRLALTFPDRRVIDEDVELGDPVVTAFWDRPVRGRPVIGPWADALSDLMGRHVRLLRAEEPGGGADDSAVSILSDASLVKLAKQSGEQEVDGRRFRMLVHVAGTKPHEEDAWIGHEVAIGDALVRVTKNDARCRMTTRNPETGVKDFDTLKEIKSYRGLREGKSIDFGVYADVVTPGTIRVGDPVERR